MMASNSAGNGLLVVDAMQYNKPERVRFEEWRKGHKSSPLAPTPAE